MCIRDSMYDLKKNIICGYVFGLSFNLTAFYWIGVNSGADLISVLGSLFAAVFYLASFWAGAGFLSSLILKEDQHISGNQFFPFIIVMVEYARSFGALGFPWSNLALTQSKYIYFVQFIEVTGTYGVSFVIIGINIILYNMILHSQMKCIVYLYATDRLLICVHIINKSPYTINKSPNNIRQCNTVRLFFYIIYF